MAKRLVRTSFVVCLVALGLSTLAAAGDRSSRDRYNSATNMKQILLAMHNFHADFGYLCPAGYCDFKLPEEKRKPLLSWRVALLPYLEEMKLYQEFRFDEPWDSEHNRKLIPKLPKVYQMPGKKGPYDGKTHYQVFVNAENYNGKYAAALHLFPPKKLTLGQMSVQDGTSNTILLVEAREAVIWTKPDDVVIDQDIEDDAKPLPSIGADADWKLCQVGFGDGSVRSVKLDAVDAKTFKKLFRTMIGVKDGEVVDLQPILD